MTDTLSPEERSKRMSGIRGKDTKPEMVVRRLVYSMGYRYRLHSKKLPGHPDLVFTGRRKIIFVHGCFWHQHEGCRIYGKVRSKLGFWEPKLEGNKKRDRENQAKLLESGWRFLVVWECEVRNQAVLAERIGEFLEEKR